MTTKSISHLWATLCASFLLMACTSDEGLSPIEPVDDCGRLELHLGVSTRATTTVISAAEARNFLITVTRGQDIVRGPQALGDMDLRFPAGQGYAVFAENCNEDTAESANGGWGQKRFIGLSSDFGIQHSQTTQVTVGLGVANAAFCVVIAPAMAHYFRESGSVVVAVDGRQLVWTMDNAGCPQQEGIVAEGQMAFFNIPEEGTRTINYAIRMVADGGQIIEQTGSATLSPAKNTRLNINAASGEMGLSIHVDEQILTAQELLVVGPDDVIQDDGKTAGLAEHEGYTTDGSEVDYDSYNGN